MDIPGLSDGDSGSDSDTSRLTKRTAIVVVVAGIIALGAGAGITSTFFDSGVQQVTAQAGPDGASASLSIPDGSTASVSFDGTAVAEASSGVGLQQLDVSVEQGGDVELSGVSKVSPDTVDSTPAGDTAGYLSIDHDGDAEIDSVSFTFEINESQLEESGVDPGNVTLYRLNDGEWQPLETALQSNANGVYTYQAVSPGLSVFAAGETQVTESEEADTDTEETSDGEPESDGSEETTLTGTPEESETPSGTETGTPGSDEPEDTGGEATDNGGSNDDDGGSTGPPADAGPPSGSDGSDGQPQQPQFTLSMTAESSIDSIANDRGDVDVVSGGVEGTVTWSQPRATQIVITVSIDDEGTTREVREANASLTNQTQVSLESVLLDTRLLYLTGSDAESLSVDTDGVTQSFERAITVEATLYSGSQELATVSDTDTVEFTVTNEEAASSGAGGSNAGAK